MGKRKLRFDAKKSFECKKYGRISELTVSIPLQHASVNANDADSSELIISLPLSAYTSATLYTCSTSSPCMFTYLPHIHIDQAKGNRTREGIWHSNYPETARCSYGWESQQPNQTHLVPPKLFLPAPCPKCILCWGANRHLTKTSWQLASVSHFVLNYFSMLMIHCTLMGGRGS